MMCRLRVRARITVLVSEINMLRVEADVVGRLK